MIYVPPRLEVLTFLAKENVLLITSSANISDQMEALWSDGFDQKSN